MKKKITIKIISDFKGLKEIDQDKDDIKDLEEAFSNAVYKSIQNFVCEDENFNEIVFENMASDYIPDEIKNVSDLGDFSIRVEDIEEDGKKQNGKSKKKK